MWGSVFLVHGNAPEAYMVKFHVVNDPVCTCPAYRYSGLYDEQTCKHIKHVKKHGCFYYEPYKDPKDNLPTAGQNDLDTANITLFSTTGKNVIEELCPACNQPMIEVYT